MEMGRLLVYFFARNMNGLMYIEMLNENVLPELLNSSNNQFVNGSFQRLWWAKDGEPPHRTVQVSEFLTEFVQRRIIALNYPIEWPPRSPDITPCDYFYGGLLEE